MLTGTLTEWLIRQGQDMVLMALQRGHIPKHIAFIMDGHSRFARDHQLEILEAHSLGIEALSRCLALCYQVGIRHVTVFSFSRDNLGRNHHEADALLYMIMTKLTHLALYDDLLSRFGVRIHFLGDMALLRDDVRQAMQKCMDLTRHHKSKVLNICAPYSSREEISSAIRSTVTEYSVPVIKSPLNRPVSESRIAKALYMQRLGTVEEDPSEEAESEDGAAPASSVTTFALSSSSSVSTINPLSHSEQDGLSSTTDSSSPHTASTTPSSLTISFPNPDVIQAATITHHTLTSNSPPLDILVRTSGVNRLSDFMLWQSHEKTEFVVVDTLWPSFGFWDFCNIILDWQWKKKEAEQAKKCPGFRRATVKT